jgi:hypothetical protein
MINICIPCLKNLSGLLTEIQSLENGTLKPDKYFIIDNGNIINQYIPKAMVQHPPMNIGVAKSWNYFINIVPEIRIICNDDLIFGPDSLKILVDHYVDDKITCPFIANMFSCFILPDKIVKEVGLFDETISPNYGYFEDGDYYRRMLLKGYGIPNDIYCGIEHEKSTTLRLYNNDERHNHDVKFRLAEKNFKSKWGGPPGHEAYTEAYNGRK